MSPRGGGMFAEIFGVLHPGKLRLLHGLALRTQSSSSGFMAEFEGTPARIEIKNLAEPKDWIY